MQFQNQRNYILQHFQQYRIIQPQVVFIHGLPQSLSKPSIIKNMLKTLGKTKRINIQYLNKDFYSAFVQFQLQVSAALIIAILNQQTFLNRVLRVFYGSTKFCPHYLKGHQCRLSQCNYAHYYAAHLTHLRDKAKDIDHNYIAHIHITQNYYEVIDQIQKLISQSSDLGCLLQIGKERLKFYLPQRQNNLLGQDVENQIVREQEMDKDWNSIEKQIFQETQQKKEKLEKQVQEYKRTKVQQFLEAADKFLSRLIFQSSQFAY